MEHSINLSVFQLIHLLGGFALGASACYFFFNILKPLFQIFTRVALNRSIPDSDKDKDWVEEVVENQKKVSRITTRVFLLSALILIINAILESLFIGKN